MTTSSFIKSKSILKFRLSDFLPLPGQRLFVLVTVSAAVFVAFPILSLIIIAVAGSVSSLLHITYNVLPGAVFTTTCLLAGVALLTAFIGTMTAWLIAYHDFPGRSVLSWALVLPLAVPAYIGAYAFTEFFEFTGPLQNIIRAIGGFKTARDYWFPEIRSLPGAVFILSLVLYPYVYLTTRSIFYFQGRRLVEAARSLGSSQAKILFRILLPLARPAIIIGVTLALMETLNDIGAIEHLGVRTLTLSVYSIWLNQDDIAGAAQISLILFLIALTLIYIERRSRGDRKFFETRGNSLGSPLQRKKLKPLHSCFAIFTCFAPVLLGFGIPVYILGGFTLRFYSSQLDTRLLEAFGTTLLLSTVAAILTVCIALLLTYTVRLTTNRTLNILVRFASVGYAIPGTIIALGIFLPLAQFDNFIDQQTRTYFGFSTGLLLTGSGITLVYAYTVRFMAMAEGTIDGGFQKLPPSLDMAARSLGRTPAAVVREIFFPLLRSTLAIAALLVFIESSKELSATILLRPFGLNTLSTYIYELASRSLIEEAGLAAILIVASGIVPVVFISKVMLHD